MFSWRNKKIFTGYPPLSRPMKRATTIPGYGPGRLVNSYPLLSGHNKTIKYQLGFSLAQNMEYLTPVLAVGTPKFQRNLAKLHSTTLF